MVVGEDKVYELKWRQPCQLSWNREFGWVALDDVGKNPAMRCTICCKSESDADKTELLEMYLKSKKHCWSADGISLASQLNRLPTTPSSIGFWITAENKLYGKLFVQEDNLHT